MIEILKSVARSHTVIHNVVYEFPDCDLSYMGESGRRIEAFRTLLYFYNFLYSLYYKCNVIFSHPYSLLIFSHLFCFKLIAQSNILTYILKPSVPFSKIGHRDIIIGK